MTDAEQAVVDRIKILIHEAARKKTSYVRPPKNVLRAITHLGLEPEECTVEVLRALWAIHDEFGGADRLIPLGWMEVWAYLADYLVGMQRRERAAARLAINTLGVEQRFD